MSIQSEILTNSMTRADKRSALDKEGRWSSTNSGAYLRGPAPPKGLTKDAKIKANFFGALVDSIIPNMVKAQENKDKAEIEKGKASWVTATKTQREDWAQYAVILPFL